MHVSSRGGGQIRSALSGLQYILPFKFSLWLMVPLVATVVALAVAMTTPAMGQCPGLDPYFQNGEAYIQSAIQMAIEDVVNAVLPGEVPPLNINGSTRQPSGNSATCPEPTQYMGNFVEQMFEAWVRARGVGGGCSCACVVSSSGVVPLTRLPSHVCSMLS